MRKLALLGAVGCWFGVLSASELYWLQVPTAAGSRFRIVMAEQPVTESREAGRPEAVSYFDGRTDGPVSSFFTEIDRAKRGRQRLKDAGASPYQFSLVSSHQSVPEPTGAVLMALGLVCLSLRRRLRP